MRIILICLFLSISSIQCMELVEPTCSREKMLAIARIDMTNLTDGQYHLCRAISENDEETIEDITLFHPYGWVNFSCPLDVEHLGPYSHVRYPIAYNRTTPICRAAKNGSLGIVRLLLKKGAKLNERFCPLVDAAKNGNEPIVDYLLSKGADVNHQDCNGDTPLYLALLLDHEKVAQKLIAHGASKDFALGNACREYKNPKNANADVIRWLMRNGADINAKSKLNSDAKNALSVMECYCVDDEFNRKNHPGLRAILLQEENWIPYLKARMKDFYDCCCNPKKDKRKIA